MTNGTLKDRGADFQPPAIAKASAVAHARQAAAVAQQQKSNAEQAAREDAAADKASGVTGTTGATTTATTGWPHVQPKPGAGGEAQ